VKRFRGTDLSGEEPTILGQVVSWRDLIGENNLHLVLDDSAIFFGAADEGVEDEVREEVLRYSGIFELEKSLERSKDLLRFATLRFAIDLDGEASYPISKVGGREVDGKVCWSRIGKIVKHELSAEERTTGLLDCCWKGLPDSLLVLIDCRLGCAWTYVGIGESTELEEFLNGDSEELLMLRVVRATVDTDEEILDEA